MFHMRLRAGLTGEETRNILTFIQASNNSLPGGSLIKTSLSRSIGTSEQTGKAIYDQTCIACHGASGKGAIPGVPDLTDINGRLSQPEDVLLINVVRGLQSSGSPMAMPPEGGNPELSEGDIRAVIGYLHSRFGPRDNAGASNEPTRRRAPDRRPKRFWWLQTNYVSTNSLD